MEPQNTTTQNTDEADPSAQQRDHPKQASEQVFLRVSIPLQAAEILALRRLARQAIPMLTTPEAYSESERTQLAFTLLLVLDYESGEGAIEEMSEEFEEGSRAITTEPLPERERD